MQDILIGRTGPANKNVAWPSSKIKSQGTLQMIPLQCIFFTNDEDNLFYIICTNIALK